MPDLSLWTAGSTAVWREQLGNETIALRHATYPGEADWTDGDPDTLKGIMAQYLGKVAPILGLPNLLTGVDFTAGLTWLPFDLGASDGADPRASFALSRDTDRTVVFLAVEASGEKEPRMVLGSRLGIRIVAHLTSLQPAPSFHVRITSAARSIELRPPAGLHDLTARSFFDFVFAPGTFNTFRTLIRDAVRIAATAPVGIDGVRLLEASDKAALAELYGTLPRPDNDPNGLAYAVTATLIYDPKSKSLQATVETCPLVAHALPVRTRLLTRDPASKAGIGGLVSARPNRSPDRLDDFRDEVTLEGLTPGYGGNTELHDNLDLVKVTKSRLVQRGSDETQTEIVQPAGVRHARTNAFSALSGYERARARFDEHDARPLFETLIAFGLPLYHYRVFTVPPLLIRYRAPIRPGPGKDGKTVNAQVDFYPPDCDLVGRDAWSPAARKPLQVRFALADLKRSTSDREPGGEPLGLAADPRWSWHEYCHVLLAGRTGALELRFAHSMGDALAAITGDPWSKLVDPCQPWLRGCTFPWVYLHRRHDRSVHDGWSWCGRYHRPAQFPPRRSNCLRKGYQSEQILSTSLFRLYQALGGDTVDDGGAPNRPARQYAADYTVYLILRAIGLLSPAFLHQCETADQLVTTLIDADIGTLPSGPGPLHDRVGGWAHKVVRWAFEAQGLYATADPLDIIDAPGRPPLVDIFIDDRRPDSAGDYPRGGYMPVSLDWHAVPGPPRWHASRDAIQVSGDEVRVQVCNRGSLPATYVTVAVWCADWTPSAPPKWNEAGRWTRLSPAGENPPRTVPAWPTTPPVTFGPFTLPPPSGSAQRLILAMASCEADPANIDRSTGLPCATLETPIIDLVAGDNNLGLCLHPVTITTR
ncbi:hypothetical protein FHP25_04575 [Vineibacter terrae]|uniref:Uncharacterized protein n=1 Tax=Vineibacter terrae TaxID=2586908 RepID=A0A5C8PTB4_9HYPH|nr:hypothetical protein [Vineibacter terrae]TXL80312.1 hypothetical protein FHP25_04575 [Vineibacter terrae]